MVIIFHFPAFSEAGVVLGTSVKIDTFRHKDWTLGRGKEGRSALCT